MFDFAGVQGGIALVLSVLLLIVKGFALVDCLGRSPRSFAASDTLPKQSWTIILVLALLAHLLFAQPLGLFNLIGTVAALVYLAQLRGSNR